MKIIFVAGLPASGKTTFVNKTKNISDLFVDDPTDISKVFEACDTALLKNVSVYIADPKLCVGNILRTAVETISNKYAEAEIEFLFFENNPKQCVVNARNRLKNEPNKKTENFIWQLSAVYTPNAEYVGKIVEVYC